MRRLTIASLFFFFAASTPQTGGAANYHEYKKFDQSCPTGKVLCRCHANPKERWNCCYPDKACAAKP